MKRVAGFVLHALLFLATTAYAIAQPFAYVVNQGTNVSGYVVNPLSGALTELPGSPFEVGNSPFAIQITPSAKFAYITNNRDNTVSGFSLNGTNGALTQLASSPFPTDSNPLTLAISPSGEFLYTLNTGANDISAFGIDTATGKLTPLPGSPFYTGVSNTVSFSLTPSGAYLYVSDVVPGFEGFIVGFAVNADGSLTQLAGSPFMASPDPSDVSVSPDGKFLYLPTLGGSIDIFSITSSTGAITEVSTIEYFDGIPQVAAVATSSGDFLYGAVPAANFVVGFQINTITGAPMSVPGNGAATGPGPVFAAATRSGRFLYVADNQGSEVSGYSIAAATGALTPIAGSPFVAGPSPAFIAFADPAVRECGAINVSREVSFTPGPYMRQPMKSDLFDETLTITNGIAEIPGPLSVVLLGLPSSTTTLSGTYPGLSTTYCFSASGNYVVPIDSLLPPGSHGVLLPDEVVSVPFVFQATQDGHAVKPAGYVAKLISGTLDK